MAESQSPAPRRYGLGADNQPHPLFHGKLAEDFTEKDALLFAIDTDLKLNGRVLPETLAVIEQSGYAYENGALTPLQTDADRRNPTMEAEKTALDISVKIYPQQDKDNLLAFASATIGGCFAVNGIKVYDTDKGPFVAMPSSKGKDGEYHDICCPTTKEMRKALNTAVLGEYQKATEKTSVRGALQDAAKEAAARPAPDVPKADKGAR